MLRPKLWQTQVEFAIFQKFRDKVTVVFRTGFYEYMTIIYFHLQILNSGWPSGSVFTNILHIRCCIPYAHFILHFIFHRQIGIDVSRRGFQIQDCCGPSGWVQTGWIFAHQRKKNFDLLEASKCNMNIYRIDEFSFWRYFLLCFNLMLYLENIYRYFNKSNRLELQWVAKLKRTAFKKYFIYKDGLG